MQKEMSLVHIAAGGTIDSHWDGSQDTAVPNAQTIIPEYLKGVVRLGNVTTETLCLLDSRKLNIELQDKIAERIAETNHSRILLTIGTFLMADVARGVVHHPMRQHFERLDKRVAITGAVTPITGFLLSDGGFNLGMSVAILQEDTVDRVSAVMSGACLKGTDVRKDLTSAIFTGYEGQDQLPFHELDLVTIGGSMDFVPDGLDGLVPARESIVAHYLRESAKMKRRIFAVNPFLKDSRAISDKDKETILHMVKNSKTKHVLVTSGLYKIRELQKFLEAELPKGHGKTILLTGSRLPLGITDMTDAPFNLGYAMGKIGFLPPGIHIALRGHVMEEDEDVVTQLYSPDEVVRMREGGIL